MARRRLEVVTGTPVRAELAARLHEFADTWTAALGDGAAPAHRHTAEALDRGEVVEVAAWLLAREHRPGIGPTERLRLYPDGRLEPISKLTESEAANGF